MYDFDTNLFSSAHSKLSLFPKKISDWKRGELSIPITLEIQPSERCNHGCPMCQSQYSLPRSDARRRAKGGEDIGLNMLESIWKNPPDGIVLSGNTGDPLMHPDIVTLLEILESHLIPTVLITNGELFNEEMSRAAIKACKGIRISLDASDAYGFSQSHGKIANWEKTINAIRTLVSIRKSYKNILNCKVGIGYLTKPGQEYDILPAAILAKSLGVDYIQFRPFHFFCNDISRNLVEARKLQSNSFEVLSSDQKYQDKATGKHSYRRCHGANFYTVLDARGDFYICCHHVGNTKAKIGSLSEIGWLEIMRGEKRKRLLSTFSTENCLPLCRLHAHNKWLENYDENFQTPSRLNLAPDILDHAVFL